MTDLPIESKLATGHVRIRGREQLLIYAAKTQTMNAFEITQNHTFMNTTYAFMFVLHGKSDG